MTDLPRVSHADIVAARPAVRAAVRRTPALRAEAIEREVGGRVVLKAESLQHSGSFKLRGVAAKLAALGGGGAGGVIAGTAGNHGQALAHAARRQGLACELFVPDDAPVSKTAPAERRGAVVRRCEGNVDECVALARERAESEGLAFVHPFDDLDVIAGQGSVGLELLDDVDGLAKVLVPLGGGGLASGIAIAVKSCQPRVEVIGVQASACPSYPASLERGVPVEVEAAQTIADGIAVKRPGDLTMPLVEQWLDGVVVVSDDDIGDAMGLLVAESKLVVEGAGAVGAAALLAGCEAPARSGVTAVVLSGGNVDEALLAAIARRNETRLGRGAALFSTISDRPGSLARLLDAVAGTGASVVDVRHVREAVDLHVAETGVELILETRGPEHTESILVYLREAGYPVELQHAKRRESENAG